MEPEGFDMKTTKLAAVTLALLAVGISCDSALATSAQCIDLVKECFAYSGSPRDNCFHTVAAHSFCRESDVSLLASKRAQFSAILPDDSQSGPSLVGPQLVDRECVNNFDNAWLSSLVKGEPSAEGYTSLHKSLERCARTPASDMMRP